MLITIGGVVFIISITLGAFLFNRSNSQKYDPSKVLKDYKKIRKLIYEYQKKNELDDNYQIDLKKVFKGKRETLYYSYKIDGSNKYIVLKVDDEETQQGIMKYFDSKSYVEGSLLYLSVYTKLQEGKLEPKIKVFPKGDKYTTTTIRYSFTVEKNSEVDEILWENNQTIFSKPGEYIVKLKLKNRKGVWSDWAEKKIKIKEKKGIRKITSSRGGLFIIFNNGRVWGKNIDRNHNFFNIPDSSGFSLVENFEQVKDIRVNYYHSLILLYDSHVEAFGQNDIGQLGLGNEMRRNSKEQVWGMANVVKVDTGKNFSGALCKNGNLFLWGSNEENMIKFTPDKNYNMPQMIEGHNFIDFSLGKNHIMAISGEKELFTWGNNDLYQLGNGTKDSVYRYQKIDLVNPMYIFAEKECSLCVRKNGDIYGWGKNRNCILGSKEKIIKEPRKIGNIKHIKKIEMSDSYAVALTEQNKIYLWGTFIEHDTTKEIIEPVEVDLEYDVKDITIVKNISYILSTSDELYILTNDLKLDKIELRLFEEE